MESHMVYLDDQITDTNVNTYDVGKCHPALRSTLSAFYHPKHRKLCRNTTQTQLASLFRYHSASEAAPAEITLPFMQTAGRIWSLMARALRR